jgi:uncharacterized damage-inducible protein DinB
MNQPLGEMFRYNRWANLTLLESCRVLRPVQLQARSPGVSGSVGELLTHLIGGQQTFILRTEGRQNEGEMGRQTPWPGLDAVVDMAKSTSDVLIEIAEGLDRDRETELRYGGRTYMLPVSFILTHALEHGVEHRTEVKIALGLIGVETPDLDGWSYALARGLV